MPLLHASIVPGWPSSPSSFLVTLTSSSWFVAGMPEVWLGSAVVLLDFARLWPPCVCVCVPPLYFLGGGLRVCHACFVLLLLWPHCGLHLFRARSARALSAFLFSKLGLAPCDYVAFLKFAFLMFMRSCLHACMHACIYQSFTGNNPFFIINFILLVFSRAGLIANVPQRKEFLMFLLFMGPRATSSFQCLP